MGYKTKVQLIKRANSESWYVIFPTQLAQALELEKSETVEWIVKDKMTLTMKRGTQAASMIKKT
jgi:antitoxin component of MazEF toxin-antitoxin module